MPGDSKSVVVGDAGCLMLKHPASAICGYCRYISCAQEPRTSYRALFFIWLQQCWCGCSFFDWLWICFFFYLVFSFFFDIITNNCGSYGSKWFFDISAFPILGVCFFLCFVCSFQQIHIFFLLLSFYFALPLLLHYFNLNNAVFCLFFFFGLLYSLNNYLSFTIHSGRHLPL